MPSVSFSDENLSINPKFIEITTEINNDIKSFKLNFSITKKTTTKKIKTNKEDLEYVKKQAKKDTIKIYGLLFSEELMKVNKPKITNKSPKLFGPPA